MIGIATILALSAFVSTSSAACVDKCSAKTDESKCKYRRHSYWKHVCDDMDNKILHLGGCKGQKWGSTLNDLCPRTCFQCVEEKGCNDYCSTRGLIQLCPYGKKYHSFCEKLQNGWDGGCKGRWSHVAKAVCKKTCVCDLEVCEMIKVTQAPYAACNGVYVLDKTLRVHWNPQYHVWVKTNKDRAIFYESEENPSTLRGNGWSIGPYNGGHLGG